MPIVTNAERAEERILDGPIASGQNFSVPYRVVLKRDRTTDVAEP